VGVSGSYKALFRYRVEGTGYRVVTESYVDRLRSKGNSRWIRLFFLFQLVKRRSSWAYLVRVSDSIR
jgi:hypothetical protein